MGFARQVNSPEKVQRLEEVLPAIERCSRLVREYGSEDPRAKHEVNKGKLALIVAGAGFETITTYDGETESPRIGGVQ